MKKQNSLRVALMCGVAGGLLLASCTDSDYDLSKDIDLTMGLGSQGLALKLGSTQNVYLRDFFTVDDSEMLDTLGSGMYYLIQDGQACTLLMDVGGTVRCKPVNLLQFAQMGSIYMKLFRNVENPSVRLLSNGEEATKGDEVISAARVLIEQTKLNFQGYAEGKDIPNGISDVVVCDGFTGNVVIKFGEGLGELIQSQLKEEYKHHMLPKIGCFFMLPAMKRIMGRFDWERYGGSPVLGVCGSVVKVHGRSRANAIANAITSGANFIRRNGVERIQNEIAKGAEDNND